MDALIFLLRFGPELLGKAELLVFLFLFERIYTWQPGKEADLIGKSQKISGVRTKSWKCAVEGWARGSSGLSSAGFDKAARSLIGQKLVSRERRCKDNRAFDISKYTIDLSKFRTLAMEMLAKKNRESPYPPHYDVGRGLRTTTAGDSLPSGYTEVDATEVDATEVDVTEENDRFNDLHSEKADSLDQVQNPDHDAESSGKRSTELQVIRTALSDYIGRRPDDAIVRHTLDAAGPGVSAEDIRVHLDLRKAKGYVFGSKNGPHSFGWFPKVVRQYFEWRRALELAEHLALMEPTARDTEFGSFQSTDGHRGAAGRARRTPDPEITSWFEKVFWPWYPRKDGKRKALQTAHEVAVSQEIRDLIFAAVRAQRDCPGSALYPEGGRDFIPHGSNWLQGQRWLDEDPLGSKNATIADVE
jgi:hypothetical protein